MKKQYLRRDIQTHLRKEMKRPPIVPPKSCLRQQTVVLGKKTSVSPQKKSACNGRIVRLKTAGKMWLLLLFIHLTSKQQVASSFSESKSLTLSFQ